jgi:hypothetical protein
LVILPAEPVYCHAAARLALLEEAGLINHQNRIPISQRFQGIIAHDVA